MAKLDSNLIKKLSKKLDKPEKYIKEQISKKASKNHVSSEAFFVKWLKEEGIGCQIYYNKLNPTIQNQYSTLAQRTEKNKKLITKKIVSQRIFHVGNINVTPTGQLITTSMISDAQKNANLYPELYFFENSLREFIKTVLTKNHDQDWWDTQVKKDIKDKVTSRIKKEEMNPWHGIRGIHPLSYANLDDLTNILRRHQAEFSKFFKGVTGGLTWLTQKLEEIYLTRNNIAHSSPLKKQDVNRFHTYFRDWYNQLANIEKMLKVKGK